ncbi:hypothetical protein HPB47_006529 [Ixodes persulcatus]|uniref:Uncharacterized protein n=1 Tax=Ixodes persulcatus TaxID=34615 RepID=A0AC60PB02_IXOPE|nr:hypothetical protein HPB47_006529 [Ixodes persulcatus]
MKASFAEALYLEDNGSANTPARALGRFVLMGQLQITLHLFVQPPHKCPPRYRDVERARARRRLPLPAKPGVEASKPGHRDARSLDVISLVRPCSVASSEAAAAEAVTTVCEDSDEFGATTAPA